MNPCEASGPGMRLRIPGRGLHPRAGDGAGKRPMPAAAQSYMLPLNIWMRLAAGI